MLYYGFLITKSQTCPRYNPFETGEIGISYIIPRLVEITKRDIYKNLYNSYRKGGYVTKSFLTLYAAYENDENLRVKDLAEIIYGVKYNRINNECINNLLDLLNYFEILRFVKFKNRKNEESIINIRESPTKNQIFDKYMNLIRNFGYSVEELFEDSDILKPIVYNNYV